MIMLICYLFIDIKSLVLIVLKRNIFRQFLIYILLIYHMHIKYFCTYPFRNLNYFFIESLLFQRFISTIQPFYSENENIQILKQVFHFNVFIYLKFNFKIKYVTCDINLYQFCKLYSKTSYETIHLLS